MDQMWVLFWKWSVVWLFSPVVVCRGGGAGHHVVRGLFQSMAMEVERAEHAWEERDRGCVQQ